MDSSQAWAPSSCATSSPSYLQRALPPVPPPKDEISLAPASRQPSHYRTASYSRPTSLSLSQTASFASNDTTSSRAMSPSTTSSRAGSMRLARRARSPSPSLGGEEDLSFPSQETAYSASLSSPRSVSPTNARHHKFMKKLNSKWMSTREQQDADLDFGCAGEAWSSGSATASTSEQNERYYSSYTVPLEGSRDSTYSSSAGSAVPSLLSHSRTHSTSSDFSSYTADSSLPPSPTPSSSGSFPPPLSPYTSRVPLTPRTAQRKRQSEEVAAVEALNCFFQSCRLSRVEELDPDMSTTPRVSVTTLVVEDETKDTLGSSAAKRALTADELLSQNHVNRPAASSRIQQPLDLDVAFVDFGESTFTPLEGASSFIPAPVPAHSTYLSASPTSFSDHSCSTASPNRSPMPPLAPTMAVASPEMDAEGALDELSQYFINSTKPLPPVSAPKPTVLRPASMLTLRRNGSKRPTMTAAAGGLRIGLEPLTTSPPSTPSHERRVSYTWI